VIADARNIQQLPYWSGICKVQDALAEENSNVRRSLNTAKQHNARFLRTIQTLQIVNKVFASLSVFGQVQEASHYAAYVLAGFC
jgi:hypothetical protein